MYNMDNYTQLNVRIDGHVAVLTLDSPTSTR